MKNIVKLESYPQTPLLKAPHLVEWIIVVAVGRGPQPTAAPAAMRQRSSTR